MEKPFDTAIVAVINPLVKQKVNLAYGIDSRRYFELVSYPAVHCHQKNIADLAQLVEHITRNDEDGRKVVIK